MRVSLPRLTSLLWSTSFLSVSSHALTLPPAPTDVPSHNTTAALEPRDQADRRTVHLVLDVEKRWSIRVPDHGPQPFYDTHAFVQYGAFGDDGPLRLEIVEAQNQAEHTIHALDQGIASATRDIGRQGRDGAVREIVPLPRLTNLRIDQIVDRNTGRGLAWEVWQRDPYYRTGGAKGPYPPNECNLFAYNMLQATFGKDIGLDGRAAALLRDAWIFSRYDLPSKVQLTSLVEYVSRAPDGTDVIRAFRPEFLSASAA